MVNKETRERIIALVHQEVVPAIGCTEPMAVALCTSKATEQLGCRPEKIEALLREMEELSLYRTRALLSMNGQTLDGVISKS